jgi:hypothetical protein
VTSREVLAFGLYGTLAGPIAVSSELGQVLGDSAGREAARLWRLTLSAGQVRLITSNAFDSARAAGMRTAWVNRSAAPFDTIGQQPDLTVPALDRLPAALAG